MIKRKKFAGSDPESPDQAEANALEKLNFFAIEHEIEIINVKIKNSHTPRYMYWSKIELWYEE